jgi:hypothetical protein
MATMGRYCKAYPIDQLRKFAGWEEKVENLAPLENEEDGTQQPRTSLADDDYLFLQENYVVTDGIFLDEHVIFDRVTPEWQEFCTKELAFEIPDYKRFEETEAPSVPAATPDLGAAVAAGVTAEAVPVSGAAGA